MNIYRWWGTEFPRAPLTQWDTAAAAFVTAVFTRPTSRLITRLAQTQVFRAWCADGNAQAAALWAALCPLETEHRGTRIDILRNTNARTVGAPRNWIAIIDGVNAVVPCWT